MNNEEKINTADQNQGQSAKFQKMAKGLSFGVAFLTLLWIAIISYMLVTGKGKPAVFIPVASATLFPLYLSIRNISNKAKK